LIDVEIGQVAEALVQVEPVADEKLVGDGEPNVPHRQVLDQAPVRPVEERRHGHRSRASEVERLDQVVEGQPGIDDVLHDEHVPPLDGEPEILQQADAGVATERCAGAVAGQLDELELVWDLELAREIGQEDDARLEWRDEERLALAVVIVDLLGQLRNPLADLLRGEVAVADDGNVG
jgi:hypothetical protein